MKQPERMEPKGPAVLELVLYQQGLQEVPVKVSTSPEASRIMDQVKTFSVKSILSGKKQQEARARRIGAQNEG